MLIQGSSIVELAFPHIRTQHTLNKWAICCTVWKKKNKEQQQNKTKKTEKQLSSSSHRIPTSGHRFQCVVSRSVVFLSMLIQLLASHHIVCIAVIPLYYALSDLSIIWGKHPVPSVNCKQHFHFVYVLVFACKAVCNHVWFWDCLLYNRWSSEHEAYHYSALLYTT